jgi:replication factor C subunit 2/4
MHACRSPPTPHLPAGTRPFSVRQVTAVTVFKVCDQPHPGVVLDILRACVNRDAAAAAARMRALHETGYAASDIIATVFRVARTQLRVAEAPQLELIKEIGVTHMRVADGVTSLLQLLGLCARLCRRAEELGMPRIAQ